MFTHEDEDEEEYRRAQREARAGAGGMFELENVRRQLMRENEDLKKFIQKFWNPKWGTRDPRKYNAQQIGRGIAVEMEHTKNEDLAAEIAKDHLDEFPGYYEMLDLMEKMLKKNTHPFLLKNLLKRNGIL